MGKSSKKVKSDRINALKKQYDAFLAEDKKRKERNDFILDRLDNMRYCTAVVQLRHRPTMRVERQAGTYHSGYEMESFTKLDVRGPNLTQKCLPIDIPKKPLEDTLWFQEISKNYILIPKQRSSFVNVCEQELPSNVNDNGDWQNKYEILNQLKQNEKEEGTNKHAVKETCPGLKIDNTLLEAKHKQVINNSELEKYVNNDDGALDTFKIESSEKHQKSENKLSCELKYSDDNKKENLYRTLKRGNVTKQDEDYEIKQHNFDEISDREHKLQKDNLKLNPSLSNSDTHTNSIQIEGIDTLKSESQCDSTLNIIDNIVKKENHNPVIDNSDVNIGLEHLPQVETYEQHIPEKEHSGELVDSVNAVNHEETDISSISVTNTNDIVREINHEPHVENVKQVVNVEYPIDIINVQEFTPNEDVNLQDGVNVNPEGHAMNQIHFDSNPQEGDHDIEQNNYDESAYQIPQTERVSEDVDNQAEQSGIEAFNDEQREMFYSEQAEQHYAYDQTGTGDVYNPEYAQSENYQQNEDYTYYQGAESEQPFPEINEHEETAQRYDQNYEEQYAGYEQEGYTQEQAYAQQPQEYEPQVYNQVQPESDQMQYEQQNYETVDCIEQQLDNEQEYVEKHNEEGKEMEKPAQEKQQAEQVVDQYK